MKFTIAALSAAFIVAAPLAFAQEAPKPDMAPDRAAHWAEHRAEMCTNLYAHAVGKLAELEVKLKLTSAQKAAFERWKTVKLSTVKARTDKCADMTPPDREASLIDLRQRQIAHLEARLADLKAETPALDVLVKTLDKEQVETLKHAGREGRMMRMRFAGRFMGPHGHHGMGPHGMEPMHGEHPMGGGAED